MTFTWFGSVFGGDIWEVNLQTLMRGATYENGWTQIYNYDGGYFVEPITIRIIII